MMHYTESRYCLCFIFKTFLYYTNGHEEKVIKEGLTVHKTLVKLNKQLFSFDGKISVNQAYCPEGHSTIKEKRRNGARCNTKLIIAGYCEPGKMMSQ